LRDGLFGELTITVGRPSYVSHLLLARLHGSHACTAVVALFGYWYWVYSISNRYHNLNKKRRNLHYRVKCILIYLNTLLFESVFNFFLVVVVASLEGAFCNYDTLNTLLLPNSIMTVFSIIGSLA
jgi:hypothetical protein